MHSDKRKRYKFSAIKLIDRMIDVTEGSEQSIRLTEEDHFITTSFKVDGFIDFGDYTSKDTEASLAHCALVFMPVSVIKLGAAFLNIRKP